jgi:uncharacterized phage protein gp47/JayE
VNESWINKDEKNIRDDIVSIAKEETGLTNFKNTGVLRGFIEVMARVVLFIYRTAINSIYDNATLDGAKGIFLSFWGLMLGVVRKKESKTEGVLTAAAHGDGSVAAGTWAEISGTELRYKVKEKVSFTEGETFSIPVAAEFPGQSYNVTPGAPVRLTRLVQGLDTVTVGEDWITLPGQDEETDEPYRERIKTRWRSQTLGDTKDVYRYYAEEINGVKAAHIVRAPRGPGSTDVIIAAVGGVPNQELLEAVEANLYDHELMAFDLRVKAPVIRDIEIVIEYSGNASEGEVRVIADEYVRNLGIGGRFRIGRLYDLYESLDQKTLEILSPGRDVQPEENEIIEAAIAVTKAA